MALDKVQKEEVIFVYCVAYDCRNNCDGICDVSGYIVINENAKCDKYDPTFGKEEVERE